MGAYVDFLLFELVLNISYNTNFTMCDLVGWGYRIVLHFLFCLKGPVNGKALDKALAYFILLSTSEKVLSVYYAIEPHCH